MSAKVTITLDIRDDDGELTRVVVDGSAGYIIGAIEPGAVPGVVYGGSLVAVFAAITCSMSENMSLDDLDMVEAVAVSMMHYQMLHEGDT